MFAVGTCYADVILHLDSFPREDSKVRAQRIERRRGGNGANMLSVLAQYIKSRSSTMAPTTSSSNLSCELVCVLAGDPSDEERLLQDSIVFHDLKQRPGVGINHCVFRGSGFSEPTSWS